MSAFVQIILKRQLHVCEAAPTLKPWARFERMAAGKAQTTQECAARAALSICRVALLQTAAAFWSADVGLMQVPAVISKWAQRHRYKQHPIQANGCSSEFVSKIARTRRASE